MTQNTPNDRGMTLMELIVVLAVFGLVAILSLQALSGTLRHRDRLVEIDTKTASITTMLSLLRSDLHAAAPLLFYAPDGSIQSALVINPSQTQLEFSVSGRVDLPGEMSARTGRVIWRYDASQGQLVRQSWPVLIPANVTSLSPELVMAEGITNIEVRTLDPNLGWIIGIDPNNTGTSSTLPFAVNVILQTVDFGRISTLVSYP
jgi:general secretion pathway protein J